jgi:hypothetical protein
MTDVHTPEVDAKSVPVSFGLSRVKTGKHDNQSILV